jgi:hypothetical protein
LACTFEHRAQIGLISEVDSSGLKMADIRSGRVLDTEARELIQIAAHAILGEMKGDRVTLLIYDMID